MIEGGGQGSQRANMPGQEGMETEPAQLVQAANTEGTRLQQYKEFIEAHPYCDENDANLSKKIDKFLRTVAETIKSGVELRAIYHVLSLQGYTRKMKLPKNRVADLSFEGDTTGPRSSKVLPSLLWAIAGQECASIDTLTMNIAKLKRGSLFDEAQRQRAQQTMRRLLEEANQTPSNAQAFQDFFAANPECNTDEIKPLVKGFYHAVDTAGLTGMDMRSILRVMDSSGKPLRPPFFPDNTRVAKMKLEEKTHPTRGTKTGTKPSLMWKILSTYCKYPDKLKKIFENTILMAGSYYPTLSYSG